MRLRVELLDGDSKCHHLTCSLTNTSTCAPLDEAEGSEVDGHATYETVVRVEVGLGVAHAHLVRVRVGVRAGAWARARARVRGLWV